jgi:hypothetical protein
VIEKIVGEEFFEHFEISAALHFLGVAADDGLGGVADVVGGHDVLQIGLSVCLGGAVRRAMPQRLPSG